MKKILTTMLPYLIVLGIDFYLLPVLIQNTGMAMLLLLCVMPLIALLTAIVYGLRHGFCWLLPVAALILFLPSIGIYYNSSAWVYAVLYAVIILVGNAAGRAFYMKK